MRLLPVILLWTFFHSPISANSAELTGTISGVKVGSTILLSSFSSTEPLGSFVVTDSTFRFSIKSDKTELYFLRYEDSKQIYGFAVVMDTTDMDLKLQNNYSSILFSGNKLAAEQTDFYKGLFAIYARLKISISGLKNDTSASSQAFIKKEQAKFRSIQDEYCFDWISKNSNSEFAPMILHLELQSSDPKRLKSSFESISGEVRQNSIITPYIPTLLANAAERRGIVVGQKFSGFKLNDQSGKPVKFPEAGSYKVLLLDLWASWCGPCRASNPEIKNLIKKYGAKNFKVISISADHVREDWLKAIKEDGMDWTQVSDLKGVEDGYVGSLPVYTFPTYVLISEDGTVVSKPWSIDGVTDTLLKLYGY